MRPEIPGFAPSSPAIQAGAATNFPSSYSFGYCPKCQTFPSSSWAKSASSVSSSWPWL
jgi:hypothetical protein